MPTSHDTQIGFRLAGGDQPLILVPVFVAGRGPYSFILDTGAGPTIVSRELAETLALPAGEVKTGMGAAGPVELTLSTLPSLRLGDEVIENVAVAITDLTPIGNAIRATVDGDLGHSVLQHYALTLDYAANTLMLARPDGGAPAVPSGTGIRFRLAHPAKPLIVVPAMVNGQGPFDFAVDTGASTTTISLELAQNFGLVLEEIPDMTGGGGRMRSWKGQLESLSVNSAVQNHLAVAVSDFLNPLSQAIGVKLHGIVGYNFLRHYRVTFNYPAQVLSFD